MRHIFSILLMLVALTTQAQQTYHIKHFGENDELVLRGETSIAQVNGFIWIGTTEGLRAFDGKHSALYRVPDKEKLGGYYGMVTGVVQSADGTIWTGTHRGFFTFDIENEKLVPFRVEGLSARPFISHMKFDAYDQLWAIIDGHLYRIDPKKRRAFCLDKDLGSLRCLALTSSGTVWVGDVNGIIYRYDAPNHRMRAYTVKPDGVDSFKKIAGITELQNGSLVITSEADGVCLFSPENFSSRLLFDKDDEGRSLVAHTAISPDGINLWVGSERGIIIYNTVTGGLSAIRQSDTALHTLTDNAVYTLFLDQEQGVWAGTYFGGMHRISLQPSNFTIALPEEEGIDVVREMLTDEQGRIWVGTEDGGLYEYDMPHNRLHPAAVDWGAYPVPRNVQSLLLVENDLWLSTATNGIYVVDTNTCRAKQHFIKSNGTSQGMRINPIDMCEQSGTIFVASPGGVFQFDPKGNIFRLLPEFNGIYVHHLIADRQGNVWLCSFNNGLWKLEEKDGAWKARKTAFEYQCVTSIYQDSRGVYWVGTDQHGMMAYDDEMNVTLPIDLVPNNGDAVLDPTAIPKDKNLCVTNITEDSYHRLWVNTFDGIYTYNPDNGLVAHFTTANGLPTPYFNLSSGCKTNDGHVLLGCYKGLVCINPGLFQTHRERLTPYFLNLYVNGKHIIPNDGSGILQHTLFLQKKITLSYDQNTFTIYVAAPTFHNEAVVWFRYRMNPDERWILTNDMAAIQMHNLAPGTYKVELQASYDREKWEGDASVMWITVEPPVYLSFWAICGYVLLIVIGVVIGMLLIQHAQNRERQKKESKKAE